MLKKCKTCGVEKDETEYKEIISFKGKTYLRNECKDCCKKKRQIYDDKNREAKRIRDNRYYQNHQQESLEYSQRNKEKINAQRRERYKNDEECRKRILEKTKIGYLKHRDKILLRSKKYHQEHRSEDIARVKLWRENNPDKVIVIMSRYNANNPGKRKARRKINNAIATGKMIKPNKCSMCGNEGKTEAHHIDYSAPLDIIWLCKSCHAKADRSKREQEQLTKEM